MVLLTKSTARGTIPIVPPQLSVMDDTVQSELHHARNRVTKRGGSRVMDSVLPFSLGSRWQGVNGASPCHCTRLLIGAAG